MQTFDVEAELRRHYPELRKVGVTQQQARDDLLALAAKLGLPVITREQTARERFIAKARAAHKGRYGYENVRYVGIRTKVIITCREHGDFEQLPRNHLKGSGCPECSPKKPHTTESFIEKARAVHGDRYDYSKVQYLHSQTRVVITCPEHGDFEQMPKIHLGGSDCPVCAGRLGTTASFIAKARAVHGDRYGYEKTRYAGRHDKVTITCPEHGDFEQEAGTHLCGRGCPACGGTKRHTTESFIAKARTVHGDKYGYEKARYVNHGTKVVIVCPEHGDFEQAPNQHLRGAGCQACSGHERYGTAGFIARARKVHSDRYDYSLVRYKNGRTKVVITCPVHGDFEQLPGNHLSGMSCPECGKLARGEATRRRHKKARDAKEKQT